MNKIKSAFAIALQGSREYRILDIMDESCVEIECEETFGSQADFCIALFDMEEYEYIEYTIEQYTIVDEKKQEFSYRYTIQIEKMRHGQFSQFQTAVKKIIQYSEWFEIYQNQKNSSIYENSISGQVFDYPFEKDQDMVSTFADQSEQWKLEMNHFIPFMNETNESVEMAFSLHNDMAYKEFLQNSLSVMIEKTLMKFGLSGNELFMKKFTRVYVGNEFCANLFPNRKLLFEIISKAHTMQLSITVALWSVTEHEIDTVLQIVSDINQWSYEQNIVTEVIVNDWGTIGRLTQGFDHITPVLGRLLNKRKKDPRLLWKKGVKKYWHDLYENNLNNSHFNLFLHDNRIDRYEFEEYGLENQIPAGKHSLHFPFYQITTSQYCTTYAECTTFQARTQKCPVNCPKYCQDFVYLYPKHLRMIGKGNTIYGFSDMLFRDKKLALWYIQSGIDRFVLDFI